MVGFKVTQSRRDERKLDFGVGVLPSLRDLPACSPQPSVETLGYSRMSLRDIRLPEFPKGTRPGISQSVGGTGDSPVPSGDAPDGMAARTFLPASTACLEAPSVPRGESPRGTGESPVLPEAL